MPHSTKTKLLEEEVVRLRRQVTSLERQRSQREFAESEQLYRNAIAAANSVAYQLDFNTKSYTHIDQGIEDLTGYQVSEISQAMWNRVTKRYVLRGEAEALPMAEAKGLFQSGQMKVWQADYEITTKDGQVRWLSDSSVLIRDEQENVTGCLGILQDITERKLSEEALRNSETQLRSLLEQNPDGVAVVVDGQFAFVNARLGELTGYGHEAMVGCSPIRFIVESDHQRAVCCMGDVMSGKPAVPMEVSFSCNNGETVPVEVLSRRFEFQGKAALLCVIRDVTDRKRAEEALRQSEAQSRELLENQPDGVAVIVDGRIAFANSALAQLTGYAYEEMIGKRTTELLVPKNHERVVQRMEHLIKGGSQVATEYTILRKDSSTVAVEILARRIAFSGKPALLSVIRDNTVQNQLEAQVHQHRTELAHVARLNTMGEMATGLAHELNQPLTAISLYCAAGQNVAQTDAANVEHIKVLFEKSAQQAVRAGQIIRRLRSLVAKRASVRSPIDIVEAVKEVLLLLEPDLRQSGISIEQQTDPSSCIALVDEIQIQQVLVNLILNAIDAMSETESLRQTLKITILRRAEGLIELAIRDTGKGVPVEKKDQLFDAFFTTKSEGMGMGLTISRTIVESHEGRLWMTANSDRGVTFYVTLPVAEGENGDA